MTTSSLLQPRSPLEGGKRWGGAGNAIVQGESLKSDGIAQCFCFCRCTHGRHARHDRSAPCLPPPSSALGALLLWSGRVDTRETDRKLRLMHPVLCYNRATLQTPVHAHQSRRFSARLRFAKVACPPSRASFLRRSSLPPPPHHRHH
eukprot:scaffold25591_cov72-Phaeocystis_antarctica.AAC.4